MSTFVVATIVKFLHILKYDITVYLLYGKNISININNNEWDRNY